MSIPKLAFKKENGTKWMQYGLSEKEAQKRYEKYGPNILQEKKRISALKIFIEQFSDFMVLILLAATTVSIFMREMTEAITIMVIVVVNATLGFMQEYRTEKTMEALKGLAAPIAKVMRNGNQVEITAEDVVPGDLIILETGDRVPADAVLIESNGIFVDESLLTGESVPVEKISDNNSRCSERCSIYKGTNITRGRGKAVVCATGMMTEMGKIAGMIQDIETEETPLQKRLEHLGKYIVFGCLVVCAIVSLTGVLRGENLFTMLLAGISLAVAAVPEGLPAIVTIALALGVQRMLRKKALVRKLPAVETLGCASVICSDKTGTLTENKMTVRKMYVGDYIEIRGGSLSSKGEFISGLREIKPAKKDNLELALKIGVLCNNAIMSKTTGGKGGTLKKIKTPFTREEKWELSGDPTEAALLVAGAKGGILQEEINKEYRRLKEIPFDSERKCMSIVSRNRKGESFVFTKGAVDVIIEKCTKIYTSKGIVRLDESSKRKILKINNDMAKEALRVLGLAYKKVNIYSNFKNVESELIFVGLTGMIDPPRKEVLNAVKKCRLAGIHPIMITGDHKTTAHAIARELNICSEGDKVLTGKELEKISDIELQELADDISVYARVSPKHKLRIVKALKKGGHIVAMTGDGVNDAPAIKEADIGISMGITGTDVTKEASSMILMDDNFATIVSAIEEGRVIYSNIRKFIRYMLSCNIGEVLTMFIGMLIGLPLPLLPIQILWVNLVTDGLPAIALGLEPAEKDIMMRKPRGAEESIFSRGLLNLILFRGVIIGVSTLVVFTSILKFTNDVNTARTAAFVTLVITQLIHVFECKSERKNIFEVPLFSNIYLVLAVLCSLTMIISVVYWPFFQSIFRTVPLGHAEWMLIGGFSTLGPVISSFFRANAKYNKE